MGRTAWRNPVQEQQVWPRWGSTGSPVSLFLLQATVLPSLEPQWAAPPAEAVEAEFHPLGLELCLLLFLTSWSLSPLTRIRGGAQACKGHPSAQGSSSSFPALPTAPWDLIS